MPRWIVGSLFVLSACAGPREVLIEVAIPGADSVDAPVAHLHLVALPYDRDSVLAALEARTPPPTETTARLDTLFRAFRGPFVAYASAAYRAQKLEQSLATLKVGLDSLPRTSPEYDARYREFTARADSLQAARRIRSDAL